MGFGILLFYFLIFVGFFLFNRKQGEKVNYKKIIIIPAILALIIVFLSVIKIYFIYKIILILVSLVVILMSYWHWGDKINRWFR